MTPYRCHICRRLTSDLMFCPVCKRSVCFRCIILNGDEMKYAMREWLCEKCSGKLLKMATNGNEIRRPA
jgi:hypothetical protein